MAVKTAQYIFNGQTYNLTYNSTSGKWEATVTAPSKSSYSQTDHVLGGTVKATDIAGNTTTVDQSHATLGASMKVRVKEKVAPVISITAPSLGAYITSTTPSIEFTVTDADSGVASIAVTLDGTAISSITKTAVTGGYKCTCKPASDSKMEVIRFLLRRQTMTAIHPLRKHPRSWLILYRQPYPLPHQQKVL